MQFCDIDNLNDLNQWMVESTLNKDVYDQFFAMVNANVTLIKMRYGDVILEMDRVIARAWLKPKSSPGRFDCNLFYFEFSDGYISGCALAMNAQERVYRVFNVSNLDQIEFQNTGNPTSG